MEKPRLIMLKGLPASGKSTWAKEFVEKNHNFVRINKDDFRKMLGGEFSKQKERIVLAMRDEAICKALDNGFGAVVDDTNFSEEHGTFIASIADSKGYPFEEKFFDVSLEECITRNAKRAAPVPEEVIREMSKKYNVGKTKLVQDATLPKAFIFDIDGTLAKMNGRSPYDYSKVSTDLPNTDVIEMSCELKSAGYKIIVCSGREGTKQCYDDTVKWLNDNGVPWNDLLMRKEGDKTSDDLAKKAFLEDCILPFYNVCGVFDDRDRVVKMWRGLGLTCYQVDYGNF